jgi:hypothetical protein
MNQDHRQGHVQFWAQGGIAVSINEKYLPDWSRRISNFHNRTCW